ncbi:DUF3568 family protein [Coraliomargarita akajimensis]|uniref:Lipoprotein n=1 Tax=Coraliomargarita akajimensis (strain DSM 45221 / IAM 15411 / JCM 23193 / KCTC 12865 / 04OKA010-24) TaxID=583355 RepID=D5EHT8_CORAD|nr:DUF3568 family protein [Coraliomargarita akajimensis]ADE54129.1 hypothetical protein Caka_1108 [Coraliomargarita akajimensis DSM 45221]
MKAKATLFTVFLALSTLFFAGCKTHVAIDPETGAEQTAVYSGGYLRGPIEGNLKEAFLRAIRELDEMGYYRTGERHGDNFIEIYARKVGDQKVVIRIRPVGGDTETGAPGYTEARIRVGSWGNLAESQKIYAGIR